MVDDNNRYLEYERDLNKNSPIPLYYQIAQHIRSQIESGELRPGDKILTEHQLQEKYGVSRATVRRAISDLVYEGILERRRAKGTVVSLPKLEETLNGLGSFTNDILKRKMKIESKILDFFIMPVSKTIAQYLQLEQNEKLAAMKRVRIVDGKAVGVENWYAPLKLFPGLKLSLFKEKGIEQSTYYMLQKEYGVQFSRSVDTISAVALEDEDAKLLKVDKGMPVMLRTRISYTSTNIPAIYVRGRYIIKLVINFETKQP